MNAARDHLLDWLRDAHAMEEQAKSLLTTQIERCEKYPELLPRLREHLNETEQQRQSIERGLQQLDSDTSTLKDLTTKFMANIQGMGHMMASDEVVKTALANHAFERFEAASYHILIAAAAQAGEPTLQRALAESLRQEDAMAEWVWQNIPPLTRKFLQLSHTNSSASR